MELINDDFSTCKGLKTVQEDPSYDTIRDYSVVAIGMLSERFVVEYVPMAKKRKPS